VNAGPQGRAPQFGLFLPVVQPINRQEWEQTADIHDVQRVAQTAESAGLDFLCVQDHGAIAVPELESYGSARFYDPFVLLGYLAAVTTSIRLATHVVQAHLRSPLITAKALATADLVSNGRLIAGFGVGSRDYEADAARVPFENRGSVTDDYLQAIFALWQDGATTYDGTWVSFRDLICDPKPVQRPRPPVWIGGNKAPALKRALRFGDAWVPWNVSRQHVAEVQRDVADRHGLSVGADFRIVVSWAPLGGRGPRGETPPSYTSPSNAELDRCRDEFEAWRQVGATDFVLDLPAPSAAELDRSLEWVGEHLIPDVCRATS
jgi:probable F420-dependent oxidoreductase